MNPLLLLYHTHILNVARIAVTIVGVLFFRTGCGSEPTAPSENKSTPPIAPAYLSVTSITENSLKIEWSNNSDYGNTHYEIERSDSSTYFTKIGITNLATPYFTDYELDRSRTYFYRVRAVRDTLTSPYSNSIRVSYILSIQLLRTIFDDVTNSLVISPDGNYLVGYGKGSTFNIWNTANWSVIRPVNPNTGNISQVAIMKNSNSIVTSEYLFKNLVSKIKVWRPFNGELLRTIILDTVIPANITRLAATPDGSGIAEVDVLGRLRLWNFADGRLVQLLDTLTNDLAMSPRSNVLVDVCFGTVKIWNLDTRQIMYTMSGFYDHPVYNQSGSMLMMNTTNKATYYRTSDWTALYSLNSNKTVIAFSPDDSLQIFADKNMLKIARASDGTVMHTVVAYPDFVQSIVFFPNGRQFASCSYNNTVKVWSTSLGLQWTVVL